MTASGEPEFKEDIDPVEDDVRQLSAEGKILEEERNEGGADTGVTFTQLIVDEILKEPSVIKLSVKQVQICYEL